MRLKVNVETFNLNHLSELHGSNHANPWSQFKFFMQLHRLFKKIYWY
jgi:hypothetical protein